MKDKNEKDAILSELESIVGEENVSNDPEVCIAYSKDGWYPVAGASDLDFKVVRPKNKEEIQKIVELANENEKRICVRGAGTNLTGRTVPYDDDILIEMKRMDKIIEINEELRTATVEPGVTHGQIAKAAEERGLKYIGPDAPYSGTVVGNISFTSMKPYAVKFGQQQVISLDVVLPNGKELKTGNRAYSSDSTPFYPDFPTVNLTPLFLFTRGTFGIITQATIRLAQKKDVNKLYVADFDTAEKMCDTILETQKYDLGSFMQGGLLKPLMADTKLGKKGDPSSDHSILVELAGASKQVKADEEIFREIVSENEGARFYEISGEMREELDEWLCPVRRVPRMLYGSGSPSELIEKDGGPMFICAHYVQISKVPEMWEDIKAAAVDSGLGDPPWYILMPQERGLNTYFETDFPYDTLDSEFKGKIKDFLPKYQEILDKHEAIAQSPLLFRETGEYYEIAKEIKDAIDPKGIMNIGKTF